MVDETIYNELLQVVEPQNLGARHFKLVGEQVVFQDETGNFVITCIMKDKEYQEQHFALLPESAPFQLIEGRLVFMASPIDLHQKVSGNLYFEIAHHVKNKQLGEVRFSPLDVHLDEKNIMQPDILFVSKDRTSIIETKIKGAPDFIIEILSPGNPEYDKKVKLGLYGRFLVQEYWIVHPEEQWIEVYHNKAGVLCKQQTAHKGDKIYSKSIEGFCLEVSKVF
ncbi:MAG: Uma2 family endonuclease [Spirochaetota bacterium]